MIPYQWCGGSSVAAVMKAKIYQIENMTPLGGSDMTCSLEQKQKYAPPLHAALHRWNHAFVFLMFPIFAVTAATPALLLRRKQGLAAF